MNGNPGKGDGSRPYSVPREEFSKKYDAIKWGTHRKNKKEETKDDGRR